MGVERPTFHESWHRVAELRPRLRPGVQVSRQVFRARPWFIVQDGTGTDHFRMNAGAYGFVGLLDGQRSVDEAWRASGQRLGDEAPTQGEAIQILSKLYAGNLLQSPVTGDTETLVRRQKQRKMMEVRGYLANLLFLRIPLVDPDGFLDRWRWLVSWCFTRWGMAAWLLVVGVGLYSLAGHGRELARGVGSVLSTENLIYLYATFAVIKLAHELGHGFACKVLGRREGQGGEVHTLGIMFLVFFPFPYVDVSSAWMLRARRRRLVVSAAGVMTELVIASLAAVVWTRSADGTAARAVAYNAMFVASVSSVLFNGNPLLRYDAYYALSDVLGMPNLWRRSMEHLQYLVKQHAWRVPRLREPDLTPGEPAWLTVYGAASLVYRVIVFAGIALFVAQQFFIIGMIFALSGLAAWVLAPMAKFVRYLATSPEVDRVRGRAAGTSVAAIAGVLVLTGLVPLPDHARIEGVVEARRSGVAYAGTDGFVRWVRASGEVVAQGQELIICENDGLPAQKRELEAEIERLRALRREALIRDLSRAGQLQDQIDAGRERLLVLEEEIGRLVVRAPAPGTWVWAPAESAVGVYLRKGQDTGLVADLSELEVKGAATQAEAARLIAVAPQAAQVRARMRPQSRSGAVVENVVEAGQNRLPSRAMSFEAGGTLRRDASDPRSARTAERFFEWRLRLTEPEGFNPGQRVVARFHLGYSPLLSQGWRALRQVIQQRFQV